MTTNILVIIPARGGSKGIPRKNLRALVGNPLIYYSIKTSLSSVYRPDVYVSSEDDEILAIASKLGAKTYKRDMDKASDITTLDPVIYDAYTNICGKENKSYDIIITMQPTSPLLKRESLDSAVKLMLEDSSIDTILSAKEDTHLTWSRNGEKFVPNYERRVNRQYLTPTFKETGGFLITRDSIITENNRIGSNVELYTLSQGEEIDIDTYDDWNLCDYYLKKKKILFVVSGYKEIGLGHVYNTLLIANDILNHNVEFLVDKESILAYDKIASKNYSVHIQKHNDILDDIFALNPCAVINDRLDTQAEYICALKAKGIKVINFEDLGDGALEADLVINAIYPERTIISNHYFGHDYFILRDEFILSFPKPPKYKVGCVMLSFGGVDPNNFTKKVVEAIYSYCNSNKIKISVVAGFGYDRFETIEQFSNINIYKNSTIISKHMQQADIIFTSAGRTTYEIASLQVPAIVLAQNVRETTHFFASADNGFLNLGLGVELSSEEILDAFKRLVENYDSRTYMSQLMAKTELSTGRKRTLNLINEFLVQP